MSRQRHLEAFAERESLFERFYRLEAREIMDAEFAGAAFLGPHCPVVDVIETFLRVDHAWVLEAETGPRRAQSIILRSDLLRALEPPHRSYSRFSRVRFRSLAHASADCICCFHEGRRLHAVAPTSSCREVLHLIESKDATYVPVVADGVLQGEIGPAHILRAIDRLRRKP